MDEGYVKEMERLANEGVVIEVDGKKFSSLSMHPVFYQPRPRPIMVRTLTALTKYLKCDVDKIAMDKIIIHVQSPESVEVYSLMNGEDKGRDTLIAAKPDDARYPFGKWLSGEEFIIAINSLFIQTPGRDELLKYVAKIKMEKEATIEDDGVSQTASVRVGMRGNLTEDKAAPGKVTLAPFRTFTEVEQPASEFVFRMRTNDNEVQLSLHEADGGAWKREAMKNVGVWIEDEFNTLAGTPTVLY